jgi:voltage-gated potassium channel
MDHPFRRLLPHALILLSVLFLAVAGYMILEGYTALEALYMTVITIFTVGFLEVHPLSPAGEVLTIVVIISGVGTAVYAGGKAVEIIVEGEMTGYRRRRRMEKKISELKDHYIICGFGRVGHNVAQVFETSGISYVVIDSKSETLVELSSKNVPSIIGDATSDEVLLSAGILSAHGLIACSDSDVANVYITLSARALKPDLNIVARAGFKDTEKKLVMAGASRVISPYFISGVRMAALVTRPVASEFLDLMTHAGQLDFSLYEIPIPENSPLVEKTVGEADIRNASGALILAIRQEDGSFNLHPTAASKIEQNCILVVIGTQEQYEQLEKMVKA